MTLFPVPGFPWSQIKGVSDWFRSQLEILGCCNTHEHVPGCFDPSVEILSKMSNWSVSFFFNQLQMAWSWLADCSSSSRTTLARLSCLHASRFCLIFLASAML